MFSSERHPVDLSENICDILWVCFNDVCMDEITHTKLSSIHVRKRNKVKLCAVLVAITGSSSDSLVFAFPINNVCI